MELYLIVVKDWYLIVVYIFVNNVKVYFEVLENSGVEIIYVIEDYLWDM